MNTYITQTIRMGMVLGIALFAFAGEVFAAPTLIPTETVQIMETSATLVGYVENINKTSVVWFEWSDSSAMSPVTTIGMKSIYNKGFFQGYLYNLKPDTVYYYRAVATEGGSTVYSSVVSFRTAGGVTGAAATTVSTSPASPSGSSSSGAQTSSASTQTVAQTQTTQTVQTTQSTAQTQAKKRTTPIAVAKKTTPVATGTATTKDGFDRSGNTAAVIGAGGGVLPGTLIGWIALLIAILIVILIVLMIYESSEKRKKARLAKKLAEEEKEKEENEALKK